MSAADSSLGLLDAAAVSTPETTVDSSTEVEVPEIGGAESTGEGSEQTQDGAEEGSEQELDEKGQPKAKADPLDAKGPTPQAIRTALKAMRDANPEDPATKAAVKELHNSYERQAAYAKEFPTVQAAREANAFIKEIGGKAGWEGAQSTIQNIEATDQMLYAGDKQLVANIVEDLKSEGKIESLGKLTDSFIDAVKQNCPGDYSRMAAGVLTSTLRECEFPQTINDLARSLRAGDTKGAMATLKAVANWFQGVEQGVEKAKQGPALDPERVKFEKERSDFETGKKKEWNNAVAKDCEKSNNVKLGGHLKGYLTQSFFKEFPRETLIDLGNSIKQNLYSTLASDKTYQAQMKAMWSAKSPDAAKIKEYHDAKLESIGAKIVRDTISTRYPNWAKGGKGAGRVAAADAKAKADAKANTASVTNSTPIFVASKPKWESIDWNKDPKQLLYIAGKAYLKPVGKTPGKLVTWRK